MIDFETLATTPDAHVLSLGAVICGININGERFQDEKEWFFTMDDQERVIDPDTEAWWDRQSPAAKVVFQKCHDEGITLKQFCQEFSDWVKQYRSVKIWGNGALFDVAIIKDIFEQHAVKVPWLYYNEMCYRTLKKLFRIEDTAMRQGTHHDALDDARFQMECLMRFFEANGLK